MASIYPKRGTWWARLKGDKEPGRWSGVPTGYQLDERDEALAFAEAAQKTIDQRRKTPGLNTLRDFVHAWLEKRREAGHDWRKDRGKLDKHVLPTIGGVPLREVTTAHLVDLVHVLRFKTGLANRTTRNVYSVIASVFRDARLAGLIAQTPCILTEVQLGSITDADPEWRAGALFTRDEAETLISDPRIPLDRRVVYGLGLLAGLRIGEGAALRWRHYQHAEPLGRLAIVLAYSTSRSAEKRTKTEAVRYVPVHPALASLLEEWLAAWPGVMGHDPQGDDLIVPLPPEVDRTKRTGERFRGWDYTGRRWRGTDLPALGWRARSVYDTRSTFVTLAIEDGADPAILRDRVTHTKPKRDAFSGYDRGLHWIQTCHEVSKLRLRFLATRLLPPGQPIQNEQEHGSGGGYRMVDSGTPEHAGTQQEQGLTSNVEYSVGTVVANHAPSDWNDL